MKKALPKVKSNQKHIVNKKITPVIASVEKSKKINYSEPFVIYIQNTSEQEKEWVIFGFNKFNTTKNFGNPEGIIITSPTSSGYESYFNSFSNLKKKLDKLRIQSSTAKNLQGIIYHHKYNLIKGVYTRRELKLSVMLDAYQFQSTVLDIRKTWGMSANKHLSGTIAPHSTIVLSIYFIEKGMDTPRISGHNLSPVIIKTCVQPSKNNKPKTPLKKASIKRPAKKVITKKKRSPKAYF